MARLLAHDATATALETDLLCYGVDLLDLYRGELSLRRVCALVEHLPPDAAVWRVLGPDAGWTRAEVLAAAMERRLTGLWATLAAALGHQVTAADLTSPLDLLSDPGPARQPSVVEPDTLSLRDTALMMRTG